MSNQFGPTSLIDMSDAVTADLVTALATTPGGSPGRVEQVFGDIAWDECDCGILIVTVTRMFPANNVGQEADSDFRPTNCMPYMIGADLAVSVIRCQPQPPDGQFAPVSADMRNAAAIAFEDAFTLWNTLQCTLNRLKDADLYGGVTGIEDYEISSMPAAGPLGACGGFVQTARVFWTCGCAC